MKQLIKLFFLWLGLAVLILVIGNIIFSKNDIDKFITRGVETEAIVEKKDHDNHQHIIYKYIVNGEIFTGIGSAGFGTPSFDNIKIGQKLTVFYDSAAIQNSILGDPKSYNQGNQGGVCFLVIFGPILIIFGLYRKGWI